MIERRRRDNDIKREERHSQWRGPRRIRKQDNHIHPRYHQQHHQRVVQTPKIDRNEVCPFLVRVFYALNGQNSWITPNSFPSSQLHLHLWMDTTLRQIAELLRAMLPQIRTKQRYIFSKVMLGDGKANWKKAELGTVILNKRGEKGGGEDKTLYSSNFYIGEYIDVAIHFR